jgi:hypothetical protein
MNDYNNQYSVKELIKRFNSLEVFKLSKEGVNANKQFLKLISNKTLIDRVWIGTKGINKIKIKNGMLVSVKVIVTNQKLKEFKTGLHRIRPPKLYDSKIVIFGIFHNGRIECHLFKKKELSNLKSLHLRFQSHKQRYKYKFCINRWNILTE